MNRKLIYSKFSSKASALRSYFEDLYRDDVAADSRRFCWDIWNVSGQYSHFRTPAYDFFPKKMYQEFHSQLVEFGRNVLGCHDVSPPWLSLYLDHHYQGIHADQPHGPFAFVFSLCSQPSAFTGGETLLAKENLTSFWSPKFRSSKNLDKGIEQAGLFESIRPKFNQLLVFDPRIPHGVSPVRGASHPCQGRLVIHGWFVNPRPFYVGNVSHKQLGSLIHGVGELLIRRRKFLKNVEGMISLRITPFKKTEILASTLCEQGKPGTLMILETVKEIENLIRDINWSKEAKGSVITLPIIFYE